jgi:hypothetical protein
MKEYKNGYLLTDDEHDFAVKHRHNWIDRSDGSFVSSDCECGAMKMHTPYGWRVYVPFSKNRHARSLELKEHSFWSKIFS